MNVPHRRSRLSSVLGTVVATLALAPAARADVPPPPDWKDPCLEAGIRPEDDCVRCTAPEFKDRDCYARAAADGYAQTCRGWNYAMLCKGRTTSTPETSPPPAPETKAPAPETKAPAPETKAPETKAPEAPAAAPAKSGCAAAADGGWLAAVALALGLTRRRQRRA